MKKMLKQSAVFLSIASMAAAAWLATAQAQPANRLPKNTVPLTASEMRAIYADKTWKWTAGGGRFLTKNRKFIAYSEEGGKPTFAEGRWEVNDRGRLCMVAVWITKEGRAPARSCYRLVRDLGTIYQRREPKGSWFVLRTFKPRPGDEVNKFVSEDTVSPNIKRLKATLK
jgi:hypothetical protein